MPIWLIAGGSVVAWEWFTGSSDDLLSTRNLIKIAAVAGIAYFAAKALKAV